MTEFMYPRLLRGDDPRRVLYELRRNLHMTADDNHDWASLVCYASVPEDFDDQVAAYFEAQTRLAINVQMGKTDAVVEGRAPIEVHDDEQPKAKEAMIEDALDRAESLLDAWANRLPKGKSMQERGQRTSCFGIKGSVLKRFGLIYCEDNKPELGREIFRKAHKAYRKAMSEWATDGEGYHWTATQYLCLSAILNEAKDEDTLNLSRRFAERDLADPDVDNESRAWAHGTLAELELLSLWHGPKKPDIKDKVLQHCDEIIKLTGLESFQTESTRRHFQRYAEEWFLDDWTQEDLSDIAEAAVKRLSAGRTRDSNT
jgi:hypothetical protein